MNENIIPAGLAYIYLEDYIGIPLENDAGTFYLEELIELNGNMVKYRLRGLNFDLTTDVHQLLDDLFFAYERARH